MYPGQFRKRRRAAMLAKAGAFRLSWPAMSTEGASLYSRKNPFPSRHTVNRRLSGPASEKETRHHVIDLAGSKLEYVVGDALGVFASNDPKLVEEIIAALCAKGDEQVNGAD